ncbi:hypothetical protein E7811_09570 [Aliigemmobacter aestuarii]|uniref:Uncharacterized protein n=1 Tax=Aliigemmobacter aestuarii TaxID=1445661 RepID=A0A4S3MNM8_9RHOB|nr:hypothetical protein [Gemmobacter aestuarii]THD83523.1 hypothetical protein E7811_09570 [Gemmobacter aestuarii]
MTAPAERDPVQPEDIGPAIGINTILGCFLLLLSVFPAAPVVMGIYYDGIASLFDGPSVFTWFAAMAAAFFISGVSLTVTPQRIGGNVRFLNDGFAIHIRQFFRKDETLRLAWSEVAQIEVLKMGRNADSIAIRPRNGAPFRFQIHLLAVRTDEALARFRASAHVAGYRLAPGSGFNVLIVERHIWRVEPIDTAPPVP